MAGDSVELQPGQLKWVGVVGLPGPYQRWNKAIGESFLSPQNRDRPLYLDIDADRLRAVAARAEMNVETAEADFVTAVREVLRVGYPDMYAAPLRWVHRDARDLRLPPFLALLGLTVLAASKMAADQQMAANNYYGRLAQLLSTDYDVASDFPRVVRAWEALNIWLDETHKGLLGKSTARAPGHFNRIGYPISQCLMREQDRRQLPAFYKWARLQPGDEPTVCELETLLQRWVRSGNSHLTMYARHKLEETGPLFAEVVSNELRAWSGEIESEEGSTARAAAVWLGLRQITPSSVQLFFVPQRPNGFPDMFQALDRDLGAIDGWYEPFPASLGELKRSHTWATGDGALTLRFEPKPVYALKMEESLGLWREVRQLAIGDQAVVLAEEGWEIWVRRTLDSVATPGWDILDVDGLPDGYVAFSDVSISSAGEPTWSTLDCLCPAQRVGLSLGGGLTLQPGVWLTGAEPTVHVRTIGGEEQVELFVDDLCVAELPPEGSSFPLSSLGLPAGQHTVRVGDRSRQFLSVQGRDGPPRSAELGTIATALQRRDRAYEPAKNAPQLGSRPSVPGVVYIRGAEVIGRSEDLPPAPLVLNPCARHFYLLGRNPGEGLSVPGHFHFKWPLGPKDQCYPIVARPTFPVRWLVRKNHGAHGWNIVPCEPFDGPSKDAPGDVSAEQIEAWTNVLLRSFRNLRSLKPRSRALLEAYRGVASALRERS